MGSHIHGGAHLTPSITLFSSESFQPLFSRTPSKVLASAALGLPTKHMPVLCETPPSSPPPPPTCTSSSGSCKG